MLRRLLRGLVFMLAAIAVLIVVGIAVLETAWFKDRLRVLAVERAAPYLNGELSIGRLEGSLFRGVELHDVQIAQANASLVRAESIIVRYAPVRLWRDGLAFDTVEIEDPSVHLVQHANGTWNVTQLVRARGSSGGGASFRIDNLHIRGADVTVDPAASEPRRLTDVDLTGSLRYEDREFAMEIESLTGRDERSGFVVEELAGLFKHNFRDVEASFSARGSESRVRGRVEGDANANGRQLTASIDVERLNLAQLLERPNLASDITGHAEVKASIPARAGETTAVSYRFRGPSVAAFGYAGNAVDVAGRLEGGRVTFEGSATAYGARATIDGAWRFSTPSGARTGLTATGTFANADLRRLPDALPIPPLESRLAGRYALQYVDGALTADATLDRSSVEGAAIEAGTTGRLTTSGGRAQYEATGNLAGLNPARLSEPLEIPTLAEARFQGELTGAFRVSGESARGRQHLVADSTLTNSVLGGSTFPEMNLHVELDDRRLLVGARGSFDGLTGLLPGLPEDVPMDLDGKTDATVVIHEIGAPLTPEAIDVAGTVALGPSTVRGLSLSSASLTGELKDGVLSLQSASIDAPSLQVTASGTAALGPSGESNLSVVLFSDDLRPLGEIIGRPLSGGAELNATVTGPAAEPRAAGTLNARSLAYGDSVSALTLDTKFDAAMPGRDPSALGVHATSEATFLKAGNFEFIRAALMTDYANRELVVETRLEEAERTLDMAGVLALEPDARRVTFRRLALGTQATTWAMPTDRQASIEFGSNRVTVDDLVLGRGEQQLAVSGSLPIDAPAPDALLKLTLSNIQLADVNSLMLGTRRIGGVANGSVEVTGALEAPAVDATVTMTQASVEGVAVERVQADVQYDGGLATIDAVLDQTLNAQLSVTGTVPVAAPATESGAGMDLQVKSSPVSLALAQAFTTEVSAVTGTGQFDLHVTGTFDAPLVNGSLSIDGAGFSVAGTGVDYRNGVARLNFQDNRLQIDQFSIADEGGHVLQVAGGLELTGKQADREFNVTFMADGFSLVDNDLGVIRVDALFQAQGDFASPRLSGDVRVSEGRIEVDRVLELTTSDVYSTTPQQLSDERPAPAAPAEAAAEGAAPSVVPPTAEIAQAIDEAGSEASDGGGPLFGRVDLNLHFRIPDNLILRGRDLRTGGSTVGLGDMNIIAGGELDVRKSPNAPTSLVGALEIIRGYYSFQGRRFDVRPESTVRFRGQTPIDPALAVIADRTISGVIASVEVEGTMREPQIALSSKPPLDEADLLALIVFGQPINELGTAQQASLSERAAVMAAGAIATPIADAVASALNLDLFEIQTVGTDAASVAFGSQIGSRLYVGIRQQVGRGDASALSLEYRVADFLRFVTTVVHGAAERNAFERREETGGDMILTWRY